MTLLYRRITYIIFIIIFLVVAPSVILYAQGYRYNFRHNRIQKTGILIISSIPRRATVYLNEKIVKDKNTPAKIENLLPADYEIRLTKEGYHDWRKKLPIYDNKTTFAEDIILWKKEVPIQIKNINPIDWKMSPDKTKIAIITDQNTIKSINLETDQIQDLGQTSSDNAKIINWSNTSKKILITDGEKTNKKYSVFYTNIIQPAKTITNYNYEKIIWDLENDNTLYAFNQTGVWQIDLFTQKREQIIKEPVDDFIKTNQGTYIIKDERTYQYQEDGNNQPIAEIDCSACRFVNQKSDGILLINEEGQDFSIYLPQKKKAINLSAKNISLLNEKILLFHNDWEIWTFNYETDQAQLITRLGQNIEKAVWHNGGKHIFFSIDNKVKTIELDNRELRNIIELASLDDLQDMNIGNKGEKLYLSGNLAGQTGLFNLNIK